MIGQLTALQYAVSSAESGARGYSVTGNATHLRLLKEAGPMLNRVLRNLTALTSDNPAQERRLAEVRPQIDKRLSVLEQLVVIRTASGRDAAIDFIAANGVYRFMTPIRATIQSMIDAEHELLDQRVLALRSSAHFMLRTLGLGALFALLFIATATVFIERMLARLTQTTDLAERRARELERSNAELEQFAYVASHDLQEPLRMVASYVQLIQQRYQGRLDADADDFINFAVDGATRMKQLINDLLLYSRAGRDAKHELVDMAEVVARVLGVLQLAIADAGASVSVDRDCLPQVIGDKSRFGEVMQNLLTNALKFRGEQPPKVHVGCQRRGEEWLFSVQDNGIGIGTEFSERIFAIFQRLHGCEEYAGTGIGLAICKRVVESHGGRIWVESAPGAGSIFFFTLPATFKEQASGSNS